MTWAFDAIRYYEARARVRDAIDRWHSVVLSSVIIGRLDAKTVRDIDVERIERLRQDAESAWQGYTGMLAQLMADTTDAMKREGE